MTGKVTILLLSLLIAGCAIEPAHPGLKNSQPPCLLPVRDFVANTDYHGHYRISPDGKKPAWQAVAGTREEIFVKTLDKDDMHSLGFGAQAYPFVWAQDSRRLLFIKDAGGNENYHLFLTDTAESSQTPVDITPHWAGVPCTPSPKPCPR